MKKILVGVDESEESRAAANYAAGLATAFGSELLIASVVHVSAAFDSPELVAREANWRAEEKNRLGQFVKTLATQLGRPGLKLETVVADGMPAESLADLAASHNVEMVVVGHRGRGAIKRLLVGSVADRLVQICSKPVLVVR